MDQVLNALKCANCSEFLSSPINLPCGHMICKSHTQVADEQIICSKCGSRHQKQEFKVNEAVADLIKSQLFKLDFGEQHKDTSKSCNDLKLQIDKNRAMFNDLDNHIHESINELKNSVLLKSEQLKVRIDEITQEFIDDLDDYEKRCKRNCEDKDTTGSFTLLKEIKKQNEEEKKSWEEWSNVLNELKFDVDKWSEIKLKCDETLKKMSEKVKNFEKELFMNELDTKKNKIEIFRKANIDHLAKSKILIDSIILDLSLYTQFLELCKSKFNGRQEFKLLYRGSRDGFGGTDFHSKCDNQPNTVTIIKTTKGYIFGGYTQVSCSSQLGYQTDSKAFLFSLVNRFEKPFICEVTHPSHAIAFNANYGPVFGKAPHDICIFNNSNITTKSFSNGLSSYKIPDDIKDDNNYFFSDGKHFQVSEIEVFQIEIF